MEINFNFHGLQNFPAPPGFAVSFVPGGGFTITVPPGFAQGFTVTFTATAGGGDGGTGGGDDADDAEDVNDANDGDDAEDVNDANDGDDADDADDAEDVNDANDVAALTGEIRQHSENHTLSASQVLHLLMFDNTIATNEIVLDRRRAGLFMYPVDKLKHTDGHTYHGRHRRSTEIVQLGNEQVQVRYRYSIADHPDGIHGMVITSRRYEVVGGPPKFLMHYREENAVAANAIEEEPRIPVEPLVQLPLGP